MADSNNSFFDKESDFGKMIKDLEQPKPVAESNVDKIQQYSKDLKIVKPERSVISKAEKDATPISRNDISQIGAKVNIAQVSSQDAKVLKAAVQTDFRQVTKLIDKQNTVIAKIKTKQDTSFKVIDKTLGKIKENITSLQNQINSLSSKTAAVTETVKQQQRDAGDDTPIGKKRNNSSIHKKAGKYVGNTLRRGEFYHAGRELYTAGRTAWWAASGVAGFLARHPLAMVAMGAAYGLNEIGKANKDRQERAGITDNDTQPEIEKKLKADTHRRKEEYREKLREENKRAIDAEREKEKAPKPRTPFSGRMNLGGHKLSKEEEDDDIAMRGKPGPNSVNIGSLGRMPGLADRPLSFHTMYDRQRIDEQKAEFLKFGRLPGGFEFSPGYMGTLGSPRNVAAGGAMPLGGMRSFRGGSPSFGGRSPGGYSTPGPGSYSPPASPAAPASPSAPGRAPSSPGASPAPPSGARPASPPGTPPSSPGASPPGEGPVPGGVWEGRNNAEKAYRYFISKGWSPHAAAGIVGNLQAESGPNIDPHGKPGDYGKAHGIAQWHPDRRAIYEREFGKKWGETTFEDQLGFVHWELTKGSPLERKAGAELRKARSPSEAAAAFDQYYERSSGAARARRMDNAERAHKAYQGWEPPKPGEAPAGTPGKTYDMGEGEKPGGEKPRPAPLKDDRIPNPNPGASGADAMKNKSAFAGSIIHSSPLTLDKLKEGETRPGAPARSYGYHTAIDSEGKVHELRPYEARPNHVEGMGAESRVKAGVGGHLDNRNAYGVVILGDGKLNEKSQEAIKNHYASLVARGILPRDYGENEDKSKRSAAYGHGEVQHDKPGPWQRQTLEKGAPEGSSAAKYVNENWKEILDRADKLKSGSGPPGESKGTAILLPGATKYGRESNPNGIMDREGAAAYYRGQGHDKVHTIEAPGGSDAQVRQALEKIRSTEGKITLGAFSDGAVKTLPKLWGQLTPEERARISIHGTGTMSDKFNKDMFPGAAGFSMDKRHDGVYKSLNESSPAGPGGGPDGRPLTQAEYNKTFDKANAGAERQGRRQLHGDIHLPAAEGFEAGTYKAATGGWGKGALPYGQHTLSWQGTGSRITGYYGGQIPAKDARDTWNVGQDGAPINLRDPTKGGRSEIQIHAGIGSAADIDKLYSEGCLVVPKDQWPQFRAHLMQLTKENGGKLYLSFKPSEKGKPHAFKILTPKEAAVERGAKPTETITADEAAKNFKKTGDVHPALAKAYEQSRMQGVGEGPPELGKAKSGPSWDMNKGHDDWTYDKKAGPIGIDESSIREMGRRGHKFALGDVATIKQGLGELDKEFNAKVAQNSIGNAQRFGPAPPDPGQAQRFAPEGPPDHNKGQTFSADPNKAMRFNPGIPSDGGSPGATPVPSTLTAPPPPPPDVLTGIQEKGSIDPAPAPAAPASPEGTPAAPAAPGGGPVGGGDPDGGGGFPSNNPETQPESPGSSGMGAEARCFV